MVFNLHAPPSMESFCMIARYGWFLQGVVDVLTLNNYQFLLFYCSYFKPQSCQVIKKEKSEKPVPRREHASKEALFFYCFLFILLSITTLSLSFSISLFFSSISHLYRSGEWVCSVHRHGPVWRVTVFLHRWFNMYEYSRSTDLRQDVLRWYLTSISPDTVQAWLYHKPEHVPEEKPYPAAALLKSAHLQQWRPSCFNSEQNKMIIWKWHANRFLKISQSSDFLSDSL